MTRRLLSLIGVCILLICTPVKAEITPQLMQEWSKQPSNVQWSVFYQNTSFNVVDELSWESPDLADTWAYTSKYTNNGLVNRIDIVVKRGYESSLTHEVGHCLEDCNHSLNWWAYRPEFVAIWQQERYNCVLLVGQGSTDIREYFAEAYNLYINYPQILRKCCPSTYNYISVVLSYT